MGKRKEQQETESFPNVEEILRNFQDIEEPAIRKFYVENRERLRRQARYEDKRKELHKELSSPDIRNPFLAVPREPEEPEENLFQEEHRKSAPERLRSFCFFTGAWLSVLAWLLSGLSPDRMPRVWLRKASVLPAVCITALNLRNLASGEREFGPLSFASPDMRRERGLPIKERREMHPAPPPGLILKKGPGVFFGRYGNKYIGRGQGMDGHVLVVGQPGSGKSLAFAIPTLRRWTGGVFCVDIKGELSAATCRRHVIVDPEDEGSWGYDPFEDLRKASDSEFVHSLNGLLHTLLPDSPDGKDIFWTQAARRYLAGAYTWGIHQDMGFIEINSKIYSSSADDMISEVMGSGDAGAKAHMVHIEEEAEKVRGSILENAMNAIQVFATDRRIKETMTRSRTVRPDMLLDGSRIFLKVPDDRIEDWRPFLAVMVNQFIRGMRQFPEKGSQRVLVMLDEFPRLGKIPSITEGMATLRSKCCTFCVVVQSYNQIDKTYGEVERRIILDNVAYKLVMSVLDPKMAEETSRMIGQHHESEPLSLDGGIAKALLGKRGRRLAYLVRPEELRNLGSGAVLIAPEGFCRLTKVFSGKEAADAG